MVSIFVFFFLAIILSTTQESSNAVIEKAKKEISKWKDQAANFFSDQRSSYFFNVPDKNAVLNNYTKFYTNMARSEKRRQLINLGRIAFYSRLVKEFLVDPRRRQAGLTYVKFPDPFLKTLDQLLEPNCTYDFKKCSDLAVGLISNTFWFKTLFFNISAVKGQFDKADTDEKKISRLSVSKVTSSLFRMYRQPFKDLEQQFEFSWTLNYYFCWFTMLKLPILAYLPYCNYTENWYSGFAGENILMLDDWKMIDVLDNEPFRCAKYSFCPDPCCFRTSMVQQDCDEDQLNPCKLLLHKQCLMIPEENENFVKLVQNGFNKSCKCNTPGFKYEPYVNTCFDTDECEIDKNLCSDPNSVCTNTVGSFSCPCRSGFSYSNDTRSCQHSAVMGELKRQYVQSVLRVTPMSFTFLLIIIFLYKFVVKCFFG